MIELTDLPDGALEDMKRYVSYAWPPGRIAQLLNRAYDLNMTRETVIGMLRRMKHECAKKFEHPLRARKGCSVFDF